MSSVTSVAAVGHRLSGLPQYTSDHGDRSLPVHVLLLLVGRGIAASVLDNHVNTFVLPHLVDEPDVILLRVHPSQVADVERSLGEPFSLRTRFERQAMGILSTVNRQHTIAWMPQAGDGDEATDLQVDEADLIHQARAAELGSYSERPGVVLPQSDAFHYEAPNGDHYSSYFRGSFGFTSRDAVDGLAFWLTPRIPDSSAILVDSPGFLGVGLGLADYFRRELDCDDDAAPTVESRDYYGEDPALIAARLSRDAELDRPVIVLSSIVSSGRSLDAMLTACRSAGFSSVSSLQLFAAQGSQMDEGVLHFLPLDLSSSGAGSCEPCLSERKPVVRIRKSTGLVEVSALIEEARITAAVASDVSDFFSRYSGVQGVVSVHRDQHDSRRHHVIDISISTLCDEQEFRLRATDALAPYRHREAVILHPEHHDAAAIARLASEILGVGSPIGCDPSKLGQLTESERERLCSADLVLLVDDVAITGSRLRQFRTHLNLRGIVNQSGSPEIGAFVGVLRPSSSARMEGILDLADRPTRLRFAERMLLPDWRKSDCPWCLESSQMERVRLPHGSLMDQRRQLLERGGLTSQLFLPFSSTSRPEEDGPLMGSTSDDQDPMDLGPRSVFGELRDESQVFVSVCSALQVMRDQERSGTSNALSETYTSPISRVLAPEYFLSGRFYAPVIVGSILRGARRFDLRATAIEPRLRQAAGERFRDLAAIRAEFLYSVARGSLPLFSEAAESDLLSGMDESVRTFLDRVSNRRR